MYEQLEELFCKYVDDLSYLSNEQGINFTYINREYNFSFPDESYTELLIGELIKKLENLLIEPNGLFISKFIRLGNHLVLKHLVEGKKIKAYLEIIQQIQYRFSNVYIVPLSEENRWKEIIKIIIYINELSKEKCIYIKDIESYTTEYQVGKSVQFLIEKGYRFSVKENQIAYLENSYLRIANDIEKIIVELGGINVIQEIFKRLNGTYSSEYKRFLLIRKTIGLTGNNPVEPEIPWGYLIGLSAKNLTHRCFKKVTNQDEINKQKEYINQKFDELFNLSKSYISSLKIQDFDPYQHISIEVEDLPIYIRNNVLYDNIVQLQQWNPTLIPDLLKGLLANYFELEIVKKHLPFTIDEFVITARIVLGMGNPRRIVKISKNNILEKAKIKSDVLDSILKIISKKRKRINRGFLVPNQKNEIFNKPLVQVDEEEYLLINPSLCSFGFFEALAQELRAFMTDFDSRLGFYLEDYIKEKLLQKNISFLNGYYGDNEECDLLIDNDKRLFFFEIKKKTLTQDAISGNDVRIFDDLSKSLVATQKQLGKHEIHIKKEGAMELRENRSNRKGKKGQIETIELDGRVISKITISLNEFGFFNDTLVVTRLLSNIIKGDVSSRNEENNKQLEQFRKQVKELREQVKVLGQLNHNEGNFKPFFNCNFYSLQQLLTILKDSYSKEDFIKKINSTHHITMGTCNFYYEYDQVNKNYR
ncbi:MULTISPECIES: hypothetical protein [Bacillus cereus group]|uniref:hypothetical protein n=1 Tax=Bacillus cereus group TaxID=86661 RepID=UPI0011CB4CBF|nr:MULTISPECIES: hypothetical protein [Bacillus cereus group]QWG76929.1 hypothetical protein EXW27_04485 [Bacillus mycoides]TXR77605.1 hypothetical protein DN408_19105 [Bacillus sp. AR13-1]